MSATATLRMTESTQATAPEMPAVERRRAKTPTQRRTVTKPLKMSEPTTSTPPRRPRRRAVKRITKTATSASRPAKSPVTPPSLPATLPRQTSDAHDTHVPSTTPELTQAKILQIIVARADAGDQVALDDLRAILDKKPGIVQAVGDLSGRAERAWLKLIAPNKLAEESIGRRVRELKASLAGKNSSALETVLSDWIAVTWLAAHQAELSAATPPNGASLQQALFRCRRAESAGRRFTSAVKTLTMVRALLPRNVVALAAKDSAGPATKVTAAPA